MDALRKEKPFAAEFGRGLELSRHVIPVPNPHISPGEICAASKFLLERNLARPTGKNGKTKVVFSIIPTGLTPVGLMISGRIGPPGGYSMPCMKYPG
jgi:hypothetical protein